MNKSMELSNISQVIKEPLHKPLVSIIVITYNSSKYVLETLESAKAQTYKNIELIVSDDGSSDKTVEICTDWLNLNKDSFINTKLITVNKNTGIPKNCNRGLFEAKGEWVKMIAGDDALCVSCIKDNMKFVTSNSNIKFCFSNIQLYKDEFKEENLITSSNNYNDIGFKFSNLNSEYQLKVLVRNVIIHAPTVFYNRELFVLNGAYDESYPFIEDWPTWYNWLINGEKIYYLPKKTVKYRIHANAITKPSDGFAISSNLIKVEELISNRFLKYYNPFEKILNFFEFSYYRYYHNKLNISFLQKIIRRILYHFISLSIHQKKNSINKYYSQYTKQKNEENN